MLQRSIDLELETLTINADTPDELISYSYDFLDKTWRAHVQEPPDNISSRRSHSRPASTGEVCSFIHRYGSAFETVARYPLI